MGLKIRINWGRVAKKVLSGESPTQIAVDAVEKSITKNDRSSVDAPSAVTPVAIDELTALRSHAMTRLAAGESAEIILAEVFGVFFPGI